MYQVRLMSSVSSCPMTRNKNMLASSAPARQPAAAPQSRFPVNATMSTAARAHSAVYRRAPNSLCPTIRRLKAVAQYCSGGFSTYARPFKCGITQSPPLSISRGISA